MGDVDFDQIGEDFATYYYKCLDSNNMEDLANLYVLFFSLSPSP